MTEVTHPHAWGCASAEAAMKIPELLGATVSNPVQLRIAARIHFLLKRDLGEGINVSAMLADPNEAREVLFVCQASGNRELVSLARQFVQAGKLAQLAEAAPLPGQTPQDMVWARHSSGFGVPAAPPAVEPEERSWRSATLWLRRSTGRLAR